MIGHREMREKVIGTDIWGEREEEERGERKRRRDRREERWVQRGVSVEGREGGSSVCA